MSIPPIGANPHPTPAESAEPKGVERTPDNDADDKAQVTATPPHGQGTIVDRKA